MTLSADRARWLLQHPLDYADKVPDEYIAHLVQPDGALLTAVLAVDR